MVTADTDTFCVDDTGKGNDSDFCGTAADINDHVSGRFVDRETNTDGSGHGFLEEENFASTGMDSGFFYGAAFDFGNTRWDCNDDARWDHFGIFRNFADEVAKHGFGDFEISDDTVFHWADGGDVARGTAEHFFSFVTDGTDFFAILVDGNDTGFAKDNAAVFGEDEGVGGTEVDSDVVREETEKFESLVFRAH